jgi:uncharacterized protein (DUF1697 family)
MRQVLLLRGINVGAGNRISMAPLRERLTEAGLGEVRTHLQSGNVVVSSELSAEELAAECRRHIAEDFGLDIDVLVRTAEELAEVVRRDPLAGVATDPRRYQVSFCSQEPDEELLQRLEALAAPSERLVAVGREIYGWYPDGAGRSRLATELSGRRMALTATTRNWRTVTALLEMAQG